MNSSIVVIQMTQNGNFLPNRLLSKILQKSPIVDNVISRTTTELRHLQNVSINLLMVYATWE